MTIQQFPHIVWDHVHRPALPFSERYTGRRLFITKGSHVNPQAVYSLIDIANYCPQHSFMLNLQTEQGWPVMPPNVFPVFNFSSKNPDPYFQWLEEDYGLLKPRIVKIFADSQLVVEHLNMVDWVLIHGHLYRHVQFALKDTIRQNQNVYVESLRHQRRLNDLPQPLRYRRIPVTVKREIYDTLFGNV